MLCKILLLTIHTFLTRGKHIKNVYIKCNMAVQVKVGITRLRSQTGLRRT